MADSEQVLQLLDLPDDLELIGIVVNAKGAERAIRTGAVRTLGFPYSISRQFLDRNQHQTPDEALEVLKTIATLTQSSGWNLVAYVSMAFGNPYGDDWSVDKLLAACRQLTAAGVRQISLADTVGLAPPSQCAEVFSRIAAAYPEIEVGLHLHAHPADAAVKVRAAYQAGCRRFDSAIGGLGGCPFAQDALVGNIPTEILLEELHRLGAQLPAIHPLGHVRQTSAEIAGSYGHPAHMHAPQ
jgi:hydroxymethylglutaryl-CoA lyase